MKVSDIVAQFPVRKSEKQKEAFRSWVTAQCEARGLKVKVDEGKSRNICIGDPDKAKVLVTAHYDTPATSPFPNLMLPQSFGLTLLCSMPVVLLMLLVSAVAAFGVSFLTSDTRIIMLFWYIVYFGLLILLMAGPANKNNWNDNTSGVAAVLSLAERMSKDAPVLCILFDNEEKGLMGSKAYAKAHPEQKENMPIINLDCVGNGEYILFCPVKDADRTTAFTALTAAAARHPEKTPVLLTGSKNRLNSDHKNYKQGIGICACKKSKHFGYYCNRIHTVRDTVCDQGNIAWLADVLADFTGKIS